MTALTVSPEAPAGPSPVDPTPRSPLKALAGGALVAGVALFAVGMATSPQAESMADADYIASLARDSTLTEVSAIVLHYANIGLGLGMLGASALVRGRRGYRLVLVGSVLAALAFLNISGMLLADWWQMEAGQQLSSDQAVGLFQGVKDASFLLLWQVTEPFALLGPAIVLAGLARAGVVRAFHAVWFVVGSVAIFAVPVSAPVVTGVLALVALAPVALIGVRLLQRHRAGL